MVSHTKLVFENGGFNGITIGLVSPWSGNDAVHSVFFDGSNTQRTGRYIWAEEKQLLSLLGIEEWETDAAGIRVDMIKHIRHYRNGKFLGKKPVTAVPGAGHIKITDISTNYIENTDDEAAIRLKHPHLTDNDFDSGYLIPNHELLSWHIGDVILGDNIEVDIEERHITVIKPKPLNDLSVKINYTDSNQSTSKIPNLFETKFPRFSYRYKFRDGEYSVFAPFTEPVFNPKYPKDSSVSVDTNVFYNKDNAYDIKEPYNKAMSNSIHSVDLSDFITSKTPEDVVEIEVLYKQEESNVIYSIGTVKHLNKEWHHISAHEGLGLNLGVGKNDNALQLSKSYKAIGGYTKGKYTVTTENIYAALPENQLLRPWDNVPRKALAQEITGSRIVYGNYVHNYDLIEDAEVSVSYSDRKNNLKSFDTHGLPSIKSQRNYQLGVIYCDKFGRETPVLTSSAGAVNVPWQDNDGKTNASRSLQLNSSVVSNFPSWVDSLKFFIKENSNPYYNLTMDRAWVTKSTYELDDSEGHIWISFPSSDRNKISEEDYIILKKKIGTGEDQVNFENKFKVIDIKNEAPDALKYQLINLGSMYNGSSAALTTVFSGGVTNGTRPDQEGSTKLVFNKTNWHDVGASQADLSKDTALRTSATTVGTSSIQDDLYVGWRRGGTDKFHSKKYKVIAGQSTSASYSFTLASKISKIDADIAHDLGDASQYSATTPTVGVDMHADLHFHVYKKILRDSEDFSGKFFVKISKNQVADIIQSGNIIDVTKQYQVLAKTSSWAWADDQGTYVNVTSGNYGLSNYNGSALGNNTAAADVNNLAGGYSLNFIQNNMNGAVAGDTTQASSSELYVSDWSDAWAGIKSALSTNNHSIGTFFIDMMHMAAGQSDASDYAKYCCVTWAGAGLGTASQPIHNEGSSSWSYPPLKTWISDFDDVSNLIQPESEDNPAAAVWYNDNLISTSILLNENRDFKNLQIDGWVGPLQKVYRDTPISGNIYNNHINGLEGLVTTTNDHSVGPRRWYSGLNGTDTGVGVDTKTYSDNGEEDRHFMHLSFFAPGKDLHSGTSSSTLAWDFPAAPTLYGADSWAANLQGIWGGGVFTGENPEERFGNEAAIGDKHLHLAMEGNYDGNDNVLLETPGPGVGYGYDINYRELYERQWDPTFNESGDPGNKIRDFIRNIYPGSQFRFHRVDTPASTKTPKIDDEIYTIKKVTIKKLYNHTSWRKPYNRHVGVTDRYHPVNGAEHVAYRSVEEQALLYLNELDKDGAYTAGSGHRSGLKKKIVEFGKAHNRRLCYIIELDKSPENSSWNPLSENDVMNADFVGDNYCDIEFLDPVKDILLSDLSKFPAIWETDPKKKDVDLDIYYEASNNLPIKLTEDTNELFAPLGCKVEVLNSSVIGYSAIDGIIQSLGSSILESWDKNVAMFYPGLPKGDSGGNEINYTGMSFKFIREDGSYTIAEAGEQDLDGVNEGLKQEFIFREDIGEVITSGLNWYNCFSFGNGLESNRVKDDFNEPFITNGVKASTTTQEAYKEERRKSGLIYSGLYNSNSGTNNLNQFIMAEKITKDLNPTYGSIQKLFQRRISLVAFCEDKVVQITSNKDAIYNADGNPQLISTNNVLGDANPFEGNFGISKNPESFASESYRAYFADKQRGSIIRLSKDGLTPISSAGMKDWFRDNLSEYNTLLGTYDGYKQDYNITLTNDPDFHENLIADSFLSTGEEIDSIDIGNLNIIDNPGVSGGSSLRYLYDDPSHDVLEYGNTNNTFDWVSFTQNDYDLKGSASIVHHSAIPYEHFQNQVDAAPAIGTLGVAGTWTATVTITAADGTVTTEVFPPSGTTYPTEAALLAAINAWLTASPQNVPAGATTSVSQPYQAPTYNTFNNLPDGGWWYDPGSNGGFMSVGNDLFGGSATTLADAQIVSHIRRNISGTLIGRTESPITYPWSDVHSGDATVSSSVDYQSNFSNNPTPYNSISQAITRVGSGSDFQLTEGAIVFDRPNPTNSWVEFNSIGDSSTLPSGAGVMQDYHDNAAAAGITYNGTQMQLHGAFFNGDELHIQFEITCFGTFDGYTGSNGVDGPERRYGWNYVIPKLELFDGPNSSTPIDADYFCKPIDVADGSNPSPSNYSTLHSAPYFASTNTAWPEGYLGDEWEILKSSIDGSDQSGATNFIEDNSSQTQLLENSYTHLQNSNVGATSGTSSFFHFSCIKSPQVSSTVLFPDTQPAFANSNFNVSPRSGTSNPASHPHIQWHGLYTNYDWENHNPLNKWDPGSSGIGSVKLRLGATFKFRDPSQQGPTGAPLTGVNIIQNQLVNDLCIRISNHKPASTSSIYDFYETSNSTTQGGTSTPLRNQLWEINKLFIKKGFSITSPGEAEELTTYVTGTTSEIDSYVPAVLAVDAVPPYDVPAWTEVVHNNNNGFQLHSGWFSTSVGVSETWQTEQQSQSVFGENYLSVVQSGLQQNNVTDTPPATTILYSVPSDWGYDSSTTVDSNNKILLGTLNNADGDDITSPWGAGFVHSIPSLSNIGTGFIRTTASDNNYTANEVEWDNDYIEVTTDPSGYVYINRPINTSPWQQGQWYLVDIEWDDTYGAAANFNDGSAGNGSIYVSRVMNPTNTSGALPPNSVGTYYGTVGSVKLEQVARTEYGAPKQVLRAIFQIESNSVVATNSTDANIFKIGIYDCSNGVKINKIIAKKLDNNTAWVNWISSPSGSGRATNWTYNVAANEEPVHAFDKKQVYYKNPSLCFDINNYIGTNTDIYCWEQDFNNLGTTPSQSPLSWNLQFRVNNLPNFSSTHTNNNMTGSLSGFVFGTSDLTQDEGVEFSGITQPGDYAIEFDFDGTTTTSFTRRPIGSPNVDNNFVGAVNNTPTTGAGQFVSYAERIKFFPTLGQTGAQKYAISDIRLTDKTPVFQGGTANSWSFDGFNTSLNSYVYWDLNQEELVFLGCPPFDNATLENKFITISQQIDATINRYEQYNISFTHSITANADPTLQATLSVYYYNSSGHGFKISGIDASTDANFEQTITIGDSQWNPINQEDSNFNSDLKNSFVIQVSGIDGQFISGGIDNISMLRVYSMNDSTPWTVSFNENVKGWTSFKSFIPENGLSVSQKYFTFKEGGLWQHYVPKDASGSLVDIEQAENYNQFHYDVGGHSTIKAVLNQEPSLVKTFNTINYEGTQAYIVRPSSATLPNGESAITPHNVAAWSAGSDILGWECSDIKTDLDSGTVKDFVEKEGKWFNYIKGKNTNIDSINTDLFSVQGVGKIDTVTIT